MLFELTMSYVRTELTTRLVACMLSFVSRDEIHIFRMHLDCFKSLSAHVRQFSLSPLESNLTFISDF